MGVCLDETELEKAFVVGEPQETRDTKISFRRMQESAGRWILTLFVALLAVGFSFAYLVWQAYYGYVAGVLTVGIALAFVADLLRTTFTISLSWTALLAKKPVLPRARDDHRVALIVTFVPSSEDAAMLESLLQEAQRIDYPSNQLEIFVFDEGDGGVVNPIIQRVNRLPGHRVQRISRHGQRVYNQPKGRFEAKTKHGNINAALDKIWRHPEVYGTFDIMMGLDPDHIPMPEFARRMLGYFRDANVAYVAGPQSYENARRSVVARLAESQQFVFHTVSQTGANAARAPMLVGTSYAVRMSVLQQVGGIQPSITEDMATSLAILSRRNPATRKQWKAVYTPDLLAHGEGPATWGAFFKQQDRWSRGAIEYVLSGKLLWNTLRMWRNPLGVMHYNILMSFYGIMGVLWLLAAANMVVTAVWGPTAIAVDPSHWAIFYGWVAFFQITLYSVMRRYNTSPYEERFSYGIYGMFMSVVSAPIYAAALVKTLLRRPVGFSVTPKGAKASGDSLFTFRINIMWAAFYAAMLGVAISLGHMPLASMSWPIMGIAIALAPAVLWRCELHAQRRALPAGDGAVVDRLGGSLDSQFEELMAGQETVPTSTRRPAALSVLT